MSITLKDREAAHLIFNDIRNAMYARSGLRRGQFKTRESYDRAFMTAMCYRATQCYYNAMSDPNISEVVKEIVYGAIKHCYPNMIM